MNENECDRDSDRIREVFAYKRRKGEILSGAHVSFGYRVEGKKFVKDENTRPIVEDFFEHYFLFYSKRKTADYIMEKYGEHSPSHSTLMYMFRNPVYYGHAYGRDGFCAAYITREQFLKIREAGTIRSCSALSLFRTDQMPRLRPQFFRLPAQNQKTGRQSLHQPRVSLQAKAAFPAAVHRRNRDL